MATSTTLPTTAERIENPRWLLVTAWITTLLVSTLPDIILGEVLHQPAPWLLWAKIGLLAGMLAISLLWVPLRAIWKYFCVLLALYLVEWLFDQIGQTSFWQSWFGGAGQAFTTSMFANQLLRLGVAVTMVLVMLLLVRRRSAFFLVKGDLDARVEPVRWLGISEPVRWKRLGTILALVISLGTLAFLVLAGRPPANMLAKLLPLLPAVLLFAAMNAFSEEMSYRASFLATIRGPLGKSQSLLITAAFFGLGHYYGVPYGVVGVLMAGLLGWLLGKSMLETEGFTWPWLIHFLQDVLIFSFMALGSIAAGG